MSAKENIDRERLYQRIRMMANPYRFRMLELTQTQSLNITELSKILKLSYTKCADYVRFLDSVDLVKKTRRNKEVLVQSKVVFSDSKIDFL